MRRAIWVATLVAVFLCPPARGLAESPGAWSEMVQATVRLSNPKSTCTGFVLSRPSPADPQAVQYILVTAAHALEQAEGDQIVVRYRRADAGFEYARLDAPVPIRQAGQNLWARHPKQDVAVIAVQPPEGVAVPRLTVNHLVNADDLKRIEPGNLVRCVVFPHAAVFEPSPAGFPLVRLGCIASYPLLPLETHPTLLVDYNTFEGDSGAPVLCEVRDASGATSSVKIIGLVQGQHFLNQRYDLIYEQGEFRKQLGLAIAVQAAAVAEAISQLP